VVYSPCDLQDAGSVDITDAQLILNQALGTTHASNDLNGDNKVNVVDMQVVVNAAMGSSCTVK